MDATARRGPKPSEEKRAAFLRAALAKFAERGVDSATTREIAFAAGSTERTLFKHFGSKQGLVQAVVAEASIDLVRQSSFARILDPASFAPGEFAEWHRTFLRERVAAAMEAPDKYRVLFAELLRDPAFRQRYGQSWTTLVFMQFANRIRAMQGSGEIASRQPAEAIAGAFFSLNLSYLVSRFALNPEGAWSTEREVDAIASMFATICQD